MSKELEALRKKILKNCRCDIKCLEYDNLLKALTPPTEEEVCEALSKYLCNKVIYDGNIFRYKNEKIYAIMDKEQYGVDYCINDLPMNLITMIGRFFESKNS